MIKKNTTQLSHDLKSAKLHRKDDKTWLQLGFPKDEHMYTEKCKLGK